MRRELLRILSRVPTDPFGDDIIDFPAAMHWYIAAALERPEEAEGWLRHQPDPVVRTAAALAVGAAPTRPVSLVREAAAARSRASSWELSERGEDRV